MKEKHYTWTKCWCGEYHVDDTSFTLKELLDYLKFKIKSK